MDKSVVEDRLVTSEVAIEAIDTRISRLEKIIQENTYPSDEALAKWFHDTVYELDALFASNASEYFHNNSGFSFGYYMDGREPELQGKNPRRALGILRRMRDMLEVPETTSEKPPDGGESASETRAFASNDKVFVVHGHDETIRERVVSVLAKLGLVPIVLNEQPNQGKTIIEKIEEHGNVGFAVVLFTPDDIGAAKASTQSERYEPRPRQNVVLELGYFWGKLGRARVCLLNSIGGDISSDLKGLGYTHIDPAGAWKMELARELRAAGYSIDANSLLG